MRHPNLNIFTLLAVITVAMSNLFFYCYFGKSATEAFLKFGDRLFESKWSKLPIELQKLFILAIAKAQRPLFYHGFNIIRLNLVTFTKVR